VAFGRTTVLPVIKSKIPFDFAQGRLSCLAALARRNDKVVGVGRSGPGRIPASFEAVPHPPNYGREHLANLARPDL